MILVVLSSKRMVFFSAFQKVSLVFIAEERVTAICIIRQLVVQIPVLAN